MLCIVTIRTRLIQLVIATPVRTSHGYLHHLDKCGEMLGSMLNTIHNLRHYQRLMAGLRSAIQQGTLTDFVEDFYAKLGLPVPPLQA